MNDAMNDLFICQSMAIYIKHGVIASMKYLMTNGLTKEEAVDVVAMFDYVIDVASSYDPKLLG